MTGLEKNEVYFVGRLDSQAGLRVIDRLLSGQDKTFQTRSDEFETTLRTIARTSAAHINGLVNAPNVDGFTAENPELVEKYL